MDKLESFEVGEELTRFHDVKSAFAQERTDFLMNLIMAEDDTIVMIAQTNFEKPETLGKFFSRLPEIPNVVA